jgi:hypothetical protein
MVRIVKENQGRKIRAAKRREGFGKAREYLGL